MLTAPYIRRGPGQRPSPTPGRIDPLRVATPWVWNGLCTAITPVDGVLRDWVSGSPPSAYGGTVTPGRDPRGGDYTSFSGTVNQYQDIPANSRQQSPSAALTVYMRFRFNGTGVVNYGLFDKVHTSGVSPWTTWTLQANPASANSNTMTAAIAIGGTATFTGNGATVGSALPTNFWLRWQSGSKITLDMLRDDGTVATAQVASSAVASGTMSYPTTPQPTRLGGGDTPTSASTGGDFSIGMVWNRSLSDQEMYVVTEDPFGFIRRR